MNMDWHRVWSEELEQDVYVNDRDNKVITKITHWTAPENVTYPKYEPMTGDDIKEFTRRDLKELKEKMSDLLIGNEDGVDPVARLTYNSGVEECITLINKRLRNTPT